MDVCNYDRKSRLHFWQLSEHFSENLIGMWSNSSGIQSECEILLGSIYLIFLNTVFESQKNLSK